MRVGPGLFGFIFTSCTRRANSRREWVGICSREYNSKSIISVKRSTEAQFIQIVQSPGVGLTESSMDVQASSNWKHFGHQRGSVRVVSGFPFGFLIDLLWPVQL